MHKKIKKNSFPKHSNTIFGVGAYFMGRLEIFVFVSKITFSSACLQVNCD